MTCVAFSKKLFPPKKNSMILDLLVYQLVYHKEIRNMEKYSLIEDGD